MSNLDDLNALESKITAAKAEVSKNEGALAQLMVQGEKEHGVKDLEGAKALKAELETEVSELTKRYDDQLAKLRADYLEAVSG